MEIIGGRVSLGGRTTEDGGQKKERLIAEEEEEEERGQRRCKADVFIIITAEAVKSDAI